MNIALILAGGKGTRMMQNLPKQFIEMDGKPIVAHVLKKINDIEIVDKIVIVCLGDYVELMSKICTNYKIDKLMKVVVGGNSRHESILNGLLDIEKECSSYEDIKVMIHNANMPLVTVDNINKCFIECINEDYITTSVAKCNGYFYKIDEKTGRLLIGPDRNMILHAKVPEVTYLKTAIKIYNNSEFREKKYESYTTGMLGIIQGYNVMPIECSSTNMKVTTPEDFELVKTFYEMSKRN